MLRLFFVNDGSEISPTVITYSPDQNGKPYSHYLADYEPGICLDNDAFVGNCIKQIIAAADNGSILAGVDALLIAAHFIEKHWVVPIQMSEYMSSALRQAAAAFNEVEGDPAMRYRAVAAALKLVKPRGRGRAASQREKDLLIFDYMNWRIKVFAENKYVAAKHAAKAFDCKYDACEKLFDRMVKNIADYSLPCPSVFIKLKSRSTSSISFSDDCFLKKVVHHIYGNKKNKAKWIEILG